MLKKLCLHYFPDLRMFCGRPKRELRSSEFLFIIRWGCWAKAAFIQEEKLSSSWYSSSSWKWSDGSIGYWFDINLKFKLTGLASVKTKTDRMTAISSSFIVVYKTSVRDYLINTLHNKWYLACNIRPTITNWYHFTILQIQIRFKSIILCNVPASFGKDQFPWDLRELLPERNWSYGV